MSFTNRESNVWRRRTSTLCLILLILIVCTNLIVPMLTLLGKSVDFTPFYAGFAEVLGSSITKQALRNSCVVTVVASLLAVCMAFFFAYVVELKVTAKRRPLFRFLAILPMLVPSITHGLVIVYLFGKMGIVTRLTGIQLPIYGPLGIIMGSFFYAFPLAFLVALPGSHHLDGRLFETAASWACGPCAAFSTSRCPS